MVSAADLGIDERASALLETLQPDKQQAILEKLERESAQGTVRNASAYVAAACMKPDALGIDDRAAELLNQLPKPRRQEVLDKLRTTEGINNPSAWVVKACMKAGAATPSFDPMMSWQGGYGKGYGKSDPSGYGKSFGKGGYGVVTKGGYGGYGADPWGQSSWGPPQNSWSAPAPARLDARANVLLQSLPGEVRADIMAKLKNETGIRNPSAWVAKAAMAAGAVPEQKQEPLTMTFGSGIGDGEMPELDSEASSLLASLPENDQESIMQGLRSETSIRNPSAWVVKHAIKAGAKPTHNRAGFGGGAPSPTLDAQAEQVLATLPPDGQAEIMAKLEEAQAAGQVRNPSAWVVRTALNNGATAQGGDAPSSKGSKGGKGGYGVVSGKGWKGGKGGKYGGYSPY